MQQIQMSNFFIQGCNVFGDIVPTANPWCSIQMVLRESGERREAVSFLLQAWKITSDVTGVICFSCYFPW